MKNVFLHGDHVYWYFKKPYDGLLFLNRRKVLFYPFFDPMFYKVKGVEVLGKEEFFEKLRGKEIYADVKGMSLKNLKELRKWAKVKDGSDIIWKKRMVKDREEIRRMRKAAKVGKEVFENLESVRKGDPIQEVFRIIKEPLGNCWLEKPIVVTETGGYIHESKGKKVGRFLLVDLCYSYGLYYCDMTKTFFYDKRFEREGERVMAFFYQVLDEIEEGVSFSELSKLAPFPLKHSLGHGIGIRIHEKPLKNDPFVKGCTFALEPGYYTSKVWIRFEDTFVLRKKPKSLSGLYG